jgi:hypothetical protein
MQCAANNNDNSALGSGFAGLVFCRTRNASRSCNIVIDTIATAIDTIDYVATDQSGLTATSTRTVIIKSPPSDATASTTTR